MNEEGYEGRYRQHATALAYQFGQPFQLHVQRCLDTRNLCRLTTHMTNLRLVAYSRHNIPSGTRHHHRRTQQHVLRISFLTRMGDG